MSRRKNTKKRTVARVPRAPRAGFLSIKKSFFLGNIAPQTSSVLNNSGSASFKLNSLAELITLAGTFEQYRICGARIFINPQQNSSAVGTTTGLGNIYMFTDYNDVTAPSFQECMQRQYVKIKRMDRPFSYYIKSPRVNDALWNNSTSAFSGYQIAPKNQWVNTASANVEHYGWKWYADNMSANFYATVYVTLYVQFKDAK